MKSYYILALFFLLAPALSAQLSEEARPLSDKSLTNTYLLQHLVFPDEIIDKKGREEVLLRLSIAEDGTITAIETLKTFNEEATETAKKLAQNIIWLPALKNARPIKSTVEITIPFHFRDYKKLERSDLAKISYNLKPPPSKSENIFNFAALNQAPYPIFKDSTMTLNTYIYKNLSYPAQAFRSSISGKVVLEFVIEKNGLPSNIVVKQSVGGGCDQEAIRILQSIRWMPGLKNDSLVRTRNSLDIYFKLGDKRQQAIPNRQGTNF
ncbi:MAG: energy transducer TonB [Bacteroidales bacterium]|nr:energy transducer TonB [Bacteroidales bacterium]